MIKGLGAGGAERLLLLSVRHRDRPRISGHVAYVLAHKNALVQQLADEGVGSTCVDARRWWAGGWVWRLRRLIRDERPDVVHAHSPMVAIGLRLALRTIPATQRPPLIVTYHSLWEMQFWATRVADGLTSRFDDARLAVSSAVAGSLPARLRRNTDIVLHGVETDALTTAQVDPAAVRQTLGCAADELVIGTVANLRPVKGYADLLAAARSVLDHRQDVRFVSIGQGPQTGELHQLRRDLGLDDDFCFLGYREDVLALMTGFDIFCLPSRYEGLPVALMEAVALGLPVVATDVGGVPEVVSHDCEALLVAPRDPVALAGALEALIDDDARRKRMAMRATDRADTLSIGRAIHRTETVYREVLAR